MKIKSNNLSTKLKSLNKSKSHQLKLNILIPKSPQTQPFTPKLAAYIVVNIQLEHELPREMKITLKNYQRSTTKILNKT